jgi:hypothetical protein
MYDNNDDIMCKGALMVIQWWLKGDVMYDVDFNGDVNGDLMVMFNGKSWKILRNN